MAAVLGLDTATPELTVALLRDGELAGERQVGPGPSGRPRHATELLPAVAALLGREREWGQVTKIAVGVGPGSFTGLRIGVAAARALALGRGLPLVGVSSLAALAAGIGGRGADRLALIDARRGEVFGALYSAAGEELWEPFVSDPAALAARLAGHDRPVVAAGDGSLRFRGELEAAGVAVAAAGEAAHRLRARHICRLASGIEGGPPEAVEPIYLRRPDAELWRERDRRPESGP